MKKNFPLMVNFYHLPITGIDDDDNDDIFFALFKT